MFLYMYIAPGQGQITPWGQNFYINIRDQIWPCHKIGQGQPRVIIWTNYDGPKAPMLKPSHKIIDPLVLEKKIFEGFLPYMGMAAIKFQNDLFEIWFYTHF